MIWVVLRMLSPSIESKIDRRPDPSLGCGYGFFCTHGAEMCLRYLWLHRFSLIFYASSSALLYCLYLARRSWLGMLLLSRT